MRMSKNYTYVRKINKYRGDIKKYCDDYRVANIYRALQYENIPFKVVNNKLYYVSEDNTEHLISIKDDEYKVLDEHYKKIIPMWETESKNAKKQPDLYNDSKWIIGKRELKRVHNKLLILENGFKLKVGFLWKKQPFLGRPTYTEHHKFVKTFKTVYKGETIIENENWGAVLAKTGQYIKDNAQEFYDNYEDVSIYGYCKSEDKWFEIVQYNILETKWLVDSDCQQI